MHPRPALNAQSGFTVPIIPRGYATSASFLKELLEADSGNTPLYLACVLSRPALALPRRFGFAKPLSESPGGISHYHLPQVTRLKPPGMQGIESSTSGSRRVYVQTPQQMHTLTVGREPSAPSTNQNV